MRGERTEKGSPKFLTPPVGATENTGLENDRASETGGEGGKRRTGI